MSTPILATKLYLPPLRPDRVPRPRLTERLNAGLHRKLTLISAPAGFGKTTLVSEWVAACRRPVAWLSLDAGDSEPTRFLTYLIAALQTPALSEANQPAPQIGAKVLAALQSPQPPPIETLLATLLNDITTLPDDLLLVLDDYHLVEAQPVDQALTFLLTHLPPNLHLVILSREDPNLPLARLRARGQLTELRATDLRFTPAEAAAFLKQVMGLDLSAEAIRALESRTEGWVAGLQLAALSMQGREDIPGFISAFAGDHRYIVDYLVEEVLQRQPAQVRNFLLQTAILDRLSGPLCDAVRFGLAETSSNSEGTPITGQANGAALLATLERGNLFLIPLDDKRQWYRYHHLFADLLLARVMAEQPEQLPLRHQRASAWYEQNGLPAEAIRHALAAEDFERAAGLIELAWPEMDGRFQLATWLGWAQALPDELVRDRPVLSIGCAWAFLSSGQLEAGVARLQDAERWLDMGADSGKNPETPMAETAPECGQSMVVVDEAQFRSLRPSIAAARAFHALALGDVPGTVVHARRALDLLPEDDHLRRGPAASLLGLAYWASGDLAAAHQALTAAMTGFQLAGNMHFAISGTYPLADIRVAQGRLSQAVDTYERALTLATAQGDPVLRGTADLYLGLGELYRERGDLEAATEYLRKSETLGEQAALPDWPHRFCLAQARMKEIQRDLDGALDLLDEAARRYYRSPIPDARPIAALKARVWLRQGRLNEAMAWAREQGLAIDDDLSYLREFEHLTLARILLARYDHEQEGYLIEGAMSLLTRLLDAAEAGGRAGNVIEILILQALAHQAQGALSPALAPLTQALARAKPEGYVRIFVDEGRPMARLLYEALAHGVEAAYCRQLLAAFPVAEAEQPTSSLSSVHDAELIEPLSEREREVLQLIAEGLTNQQVAARLYLSLHTVKVHARNIYGKLGVKNRTQAVARGKALGLLPR